MWRGGTKLRLEPGGDGRKLEGPVRDEEGECLGGRLLFRPWDDAGAQGVMRRGDTVVPNGVGTGRRNQGAEASEEGVRGHLGLGGPEAVGLLEEDADLTIHSALDGIQDKRWPEEIATQAHHTWDRYEWSWGRLVDPGGPTPSHALQQAREWSRSWARSAREA